MEDIEQHPEYDWKYYVISNNLNLTEEFIIKIFDQDLSWDLISRNSNITFDIIQRHLDLGSDEIKKLEI